MKLNFDSFFNTETKPTIEEKKEIKTPTDFRDKMKWLKNAGYFTIATGTMLASEGVGAQTVDSLGHQQTINSETFDSLNTDSNYIINGGHFLDESKIQPEKVDSFRMYEGKINYTYEELIKLYPSFKDPRVWKANFPNTPFPGEKPKEE